MERPFFEKINNPNKLHSPLKWAKSLCFTRRAKVCKKLRYVESFIAKCEGSHFARHGRGVRIPSGPKFFCIFFYTIKKIFFLPTRSNFSRWTRWRCYFCLKSYRNAWKFVFFSYEHTWSMKAVHISQLFYSILFQLDKSVLIYALSNGIKFFW